MCGIFGYNGNGAAGVPLIQGLKKLEYRGYDSAGIALHNGSGYNVTKAIGMVKNLEEKLRLVGADSSALGIAHTRWATHGAVSLENAHPHVSSDGSVCLVHNGVVDNADALKEMLKLNGYGFDSETDTEIIANLIALHLKSDPLEAVRVALQKIQGTYGLAILFRDDERRLYFAKNGSPLSIGLKENENFISSDANALLPYTNRVIHLNDGNFGWIEEKGVHIDSFNDQIPESELISQENGFAELGDFPNFMLKEIFEQGAAIKRCFGGRIRGNQCKLGGFGLDFEDLAKIESVTILGCGTSYHAGLVAKYFIEDFAEIPVYVELASEFLSRKIMKRPNGIYLAISQSGETYDTLECVKELKIRGKSVFGIVNSVGSSIARVCGRGAYIHAGPEVAVASTKAFTSQLAALFMFSLMLGRTKSLDVDLCERGTLALAKLPTMIDNYLKILTNNSHQGEEIKLIAEYVAQSPYVLFLGRGPLYPVAMEGALKLKEIAYIPCEAYASGEMKHGPIAMITKGTPVIAMLPRAKSELAKITTAVKELKARGATIITLTQYEHLAESDFRVHPCGWATEPFTAPLFTLPLQLIAYYAALYKSLNVDRPRNLAKSVTVG